jgi:endonuclease-8
VRVLPGWEMPRATAWAVFPGRRLMPAKTRVLIEMLAARLRHTRRPADLRAPALQRLADAIVALPRQSVRTAGATNDVALMRALEARGVSRAARRFRVYGRDGEPCWICGTTIRRVDVGGRGVYFCRRCQPA